MTTKAKAKSATKKSEETVTEKKSPVREVEYGTHKVYLRRRPILNHLPKEVRAEAVSKLSSVFVNRQPLKGLSGADEKKYLAGVLDVDPDDRDWSKYVRRFWAELRIAVGFSGKELEIGTDEDGSPLNLLDFIHYSFAKKHSLVADSEAEMLKDPRKRFFIMDPRKEVKTKNNSVQTAKRADREFIKATEDLERMRNLLQVLGTVKVENFDTESIENMLYDIKQSTPKKFLEAALDENLDIRAEIASFLSSSTIQKMGTTLVHMNDTIANSEEEAIIFFKNPKNSGLLNILRSKHREAIR
jgi:hypothetical protein